MLLASDEQPVASAEAPSGTIPVPTVAMRVPAGEKIPARLIRYRYLPPDRVPPDALLHDAQVMGRVALRDVPPGAYLREDDLAPTGAPSGMSGLARAGKRVVVVPAEQLHAAPDHLSPGDRVDVLAVSLAGGIAVNSNLDRVHRSSNTVEGGGSQPGDPNALSRRLRRAGRAGLGPQLPVTAVLLSEDAEILLAPDPRRPGVRPRPGGNYMALQMAPEEAHATTLALAAGQQLRFVYRPFNDRGRVTHADTPDGFTHLPHDVRRIEVYNGITRTSDYAILD
jgi:Flp pilus assembly protein CpaB